MKKNETEFYALLTIFLLFITFGFAACVKKALDPLDPNLTTEFFIDSKEKSKTYRIWVQLPEGYLTSTQKYPTMYVLDPDDESVGGNSNFFYIAKKCQELSKANNKSGVILIGIRYGDYREIDYTPTKYTTKGFSGEGGGEAFMNFIKKELIRKVESEYRAMSTREQRTIIGHSLGGLCGSFAFTNHNEAFGNYLLLSPSLIYDDEVILQYEQSRRNLIKNSHNLVFFGVGGTEPNMIPPINLLYNRIIKNYLNTKTELFINSGKGHNSSKNENIEKALEFYFKNTQL